MRPIVRQLASMRARIHEFLHICPPSTVRLTRLKRKTIHRETPKPRMIKHPSIAFYARRTIPTANWMKSVCKRLDQVRKGHALRGGNPPLLTKQEKPPLQLGIRGKSSIHPGKRGKSSSCSEEGRNLPSALKKGGNLPPPQKGENIPFRTKRGKSLPLSSLKAYVCENQRVE